MEFFPTETALLSALVLGGEDHFISVSNFNFLTLDLLFFFSILRTKYLSSGCSNNWELFWFPYRA